MLLALEEPMHFILTRLLTALLALAALPVVTLSPASAQATPDAATGANVANDANEGTRLLRYPDIHAERLVFTYAGDLWLAPTAGGRATRLTSHPGLELFAKFSPDGRFVAFTGQYDGDEQVFVVSTEGGAPRQLTFYPSRGPLPPRWGKDNQVLGWTPDGQRVLFRSLRDSWGLSDSKLYTVNIDGGLPKTLPIPRSGAAAFSPDGQRLVYSPQTRDFRHWKRYEGGWAQDLYLFELASQDSTRLTGHARSDRDPMWAGEKIVFASDREGKLNLYSLGDGAIQRLTDSGDWDLRWPSSDGNGRVVYERNGLLEILDVESGATRTVRIEVPLDALATRRERISVSRRIEGFGLSPLGRRALFVARGDIFTVPVENGVTRNLTRSPGARDRAAVWSPDGRWIYFVSDQSGEDEIYRVDQSGVGKAEKLTYLAADGYLGRFDKLVVSPHGHHLAFHDQRGRLFVLDLRQDYELHQVMDDPSAESPDYSWSPDGAYLAYTQTGENGRRSIHVWSAVDWTNRPLTNPLWDDSSPAWEENGEYLFFLSDRPSAAQLGGLEPNYVLNRETAVFALALHSGVPHPFPPQSDEVPLVKPPAKESGPITIDFQNLEQRVVRIPIEADNYTFLGAGHGYLILIRQAAPYLGRGRESTDSLLLFSRSLRRLAEVASGVEGIALSPDASRALLRVGGSNYQARNISSGGTQGWMVSTAGLTAERVPAAEWRQIFNEVWRRYRDYFYDENLHGYNWQAIGDRYRPLLEHVAHRSDLTYVLSEMIAELEVSHAYLEGGDRGSDKMPARPRAGLLGARFELDETSQRYRFSQLMLGHNDEPRFRSPLTELGVDVEVGDYLMAVAGIELRGDDNPFRLLRHVGTAAVELTVNDEPTLAGARRVLVRPIKDETSLAYLAFTEANRRRVDELSGGRIGYIHLPDMGAKGFAEWVRWFYGQLDKEALVIDVRSNSGGYISEMLLDRLRRDLLAVRFGRNTDQPMAYPRVVFNGHLACLINEDTTSDGEQFAWAFRETGLGPVVGTRSWGGTVGHYPHAPLVDGGKVGVPEMAFAAPDGRWVIEGRGVEPDVEVANEPDALLAGNDPQLEKTVAVLLERMDAEPRALPGRPAAPIKSQR